MLYFGLIDEKISLSDKDLPVILTISNFELGQILRKAMCSILAGVIMSSEVSREDYLQFALKKAVT